MPLLDERLPETMSRTVKVIEHADRDQFETDVEFYLYSGWRVVGFVVAGDPIRYTALMQMVDA